MDSVVIYQGQDACKLCLGWKRVDNSDEPASWKYWAELPPQSAAAIVLGLVKPVQCPRCQGSGKEPAKGECTARTSGTSQETGCLYCTRCGSFDVKEVRKAEPGEIEKMAQRRCVRCGSEKVKWQLLIDHIQVDRGEGNDLWKHWGEENTWTELDFCEEHKPDVEAMIRFVSSGGLS